MFSFESYFILILLLGRLHLSAQSKLAQATSDLFSLTTIPRCRSLRDLSYAAVGTISRHTLLTFLLLEGYFKLALLARPENDVINCYVEPLRLKMVPGHVSTTFEQIRDTSCHMITPPPVYV